MRIAISPELRADIIARYRGGDRPKNIAVALGLNDWNISNIVKRAKCARGRKAAQQLILSRREWVGNRRYTVNHEAFSTITPDAAYWAGFLMADGCIRGNRVRLKLAIKDIGHVEKFRTFCGTDAPIMTFEPGPGSVTIEGRLVRQSECVLITIASPQMARDLSDLGITERKTFTAKVDSTLEMNRDFWRGVIDGDGSLFCSRGTPFLSLVGSEALTGQFLAFCQSIRSNNVTVRPDKNVFKILMNGRSARDVIHSIYDAAITFLDRKEAIARMIRNTFKHHDDVA